MKSRTTSIAQILRSLPAQNETNVVTVQMESKTNQWELLPQLHNIRTILADGDIDFEKFDEQYDYEEMLRDAFLFMRMQFSDSDSLSATLDEKEEPTKHHKLQAFYKIIVEEVQDTIDALSNKSEFVLHFINQAYNINGDFASPDMAIGFRSFEKYGEDASPMYFLKWNNIRGLIPIDRQHEPKDKRVLRFEFRRKEYDTYIKKIESLFHQEEIKFIINDGGSYGWSFDFTEQDDFLNALQVAALRGFSPTVLNMDNLYSLFKASLNNSLTELKQKGVCALRFNAEDPANWDPRYYSINAESEEISNKKTLDTIDSAQLTPRSFR